MDQHRKSLLCAISILWGLAIITVVTLAQIAPQQTKGYSIADFKGTAEKYLQEAEKTAAPVTLRHNGNYYYYVPFEINKTIPGDFPGVMLDNDNEAVTDKEILKELFRYPGLVKAFSSNVAGFDKLAAAKVPALAKYCRILEVQKIKMDEINAQGNVVGVLYHGIKLAADAVAMAKTGTAGMLALAKDLAKNAVKNTILSYLVPADSRAILQSTQKAFDASNSAWKSCDSALAAWNESVSTSGKAGTEKAKQATEEVFRMYAMERNSILALREAYDRVNNYPKLVTKIGKTKFVKGMKELAKLADRLKQEQDYWQTQQEKANDGNTLQLWIDEQTNRAEKVEAEAAEAVPPPAEPPPAPACSNLNLSEDYNLYTYTPDSGNGPCANFQNSAAENSVSLSCATSNRFRNHWVKAIKTNGADKLKIKADLTIDDRGFFYSMCPNGGVKYDNYSNLVVMSSDPRPTFDAECNKTCSDADWPKCGIKPENPAILAACGVAKCSPSKKCEVEVNTAGLSEIYLVFHTSNPWPAKVTGTMSNVEICK